MSYVETETPEDALRVYRLTACIVGFALFAGIFGFAIGKYFHHSSVPSMKVAEASSMIPVDYENGSWQHQAEQDSKALPDFSVYSLSSLLGGSVMTVTSSRDVEAIRVDMPDSWFGDNLAKANDSSYHHNWVCMLTPRSSSQWTGGIGTGKEYYKWQTDICDRFIASLNSTRTNSPALWAAKIRNWENKQALSAEKDQREYAPISLYRIVTGKKSASHNTSFDPPVLFLENYRDAQSNVLLTGLLIGIVVATIFGGCVFLFCIAADGRFERKYYWD